MAPVKGIVSNEEAANSKGSWEPDTETAVAIWGRNVELRIRNVLMIEPVVYKLMIEALTGIDGSFVEDDFRYCRFRKTLSFFPHFTNGHIHTKVKPRESLKVGSILFISMRP